MCGILFSTHPSGKKNFEALEHRGPDATTTMSFSVGNTKVFMGFHRLAITGVKNGGQPFHHKGVYVICNGEIYNYKDICKTNGIRLRTGSDCEVILHLYMEYGLEGLQVLRGDFAFVILDTNTGNVIVQRDPFGVRPLFIDEDEDGLTLASELKGLPFGRGSQVPPGVLFIHNIHTGERSHYNKPMIQISGKGDIRHILTEAVRIRIPEESRYGFLLSGGFDSSIILSIASRIIPPDKVIDVFSFGFSEDAPDVVNARTVVQWLTQTYQRRYNHHVVIDTIENGLATIPQTVHTTETFDTTTIRASTPMLMLAKYIREHTDIKVLFSGEGSDEVNGSYLYFLYGPKDEITPERRRLLDNIHFFDGLRADRTTSAYGFELRVPFLDTDVVGHLLDTPEVVAEMLDTKIEKHYIRKFFKGYLPKEILWRTKAAFSDAVGYQWRKAILDHAKSLQIPDVEHKHLPPKTPEDKWYRMLYSEDYEADHIPYFWRPKWVDVGDEPSATVLSVHKDETAKT